MLFALKTFGHMFYGVRKDPTFAGTKSPQRKQQSMLWPSSCMGCLMLEGEETAREAMVGESPQKAPHHPPSCISPLGVKQESARTERRSHMTERRRLEKLLHHAQRAVTAGSAASPGETGSSSQVSKIPTP